jgi:uncharacterized protein (UPF0332 family)
MSNGYKNVQINNSILKSKEALEDAIFSFNNNRFSMCLNRIYYAIFYSVLALAFKNDFVTSKHLQLKGWFNKKFIYDEKIFDEQMLKIYQKAYNDRQESDYEMTKPAEVDMESIKKIN